jgi:hypothetical protein
MCVRSLILNAGWSKKTLCPGGLPVTGGGMAAQITMGDQSPAKLAMRAVAGTNGDAEIEQRPRTRREEWSELHARSLIHRATPFLWRCHKWPVSIRRSHRRSTASIRCQKPLFKPSLNKKIRPVEHLELELRRVLSRMARCQFGQNRPNPSTNGWKFTSVKRRSCAA